MSMLEDHPEQNFARYILREIKECFQTGFDTHLSPVARICIQASEKPEFFFLFLENKTEIQKSDTLKEP